MSDSPRRSERVASTYDVVHALLVAGRPRALDVLRNWESDPSKADVVPFVRRSVTSVLYGLTVNDVLGAANASEHPLGNINRKIREQVPQVRDWHPDFSFQHVLHYALETLREVPTYQSFREFCRDDVQARKMLFEPAQHLRKDAARGAVTSQQARDAIRWRVGLAYYSFLRELYVLAVLREAGLDARFHLLADCLFRVDFWIGNTCFELYITNEYFKSGIDGRKHPPVYYIGRDSGLRFGRLELPRQHTYGRLHVPDPELVVSAVRASLSP